MKTSVMKLTSIPMALVLTLGITLTGLGSSAVASTFDELCETEECRNSVTRFERYANNGNTPSMLLLAVAYANGEGVEKDHRKASMWMREAIRRNNSMAAYVKAQWRRQGLVFEQDLDRAEWMIDRAISQGNSLAMYDRAVRLMEEPNTVAGGLDLLERSAELGLPDANYLVARLLEEGVFSEPDPIAAGMIYRELGMQGFKDSRQRLRSMVEIVRQQGDVNAQVIADLTAYDNMEVITVSGRKGSFEEQLAQLHDDLRERFHHRATGSYMRRQGPCDFASGCRVIFDRDNIEGAIGWTLADIVGYNPQY